MSVNKKPVPKKRSLSQAKGGSRLDADWPPAWSVTFSDLTTLLMTAFVLWYSLTAAKIPAELLAMGQKKLMPEDIEYLKKYKAQKTEQGASSATMIKQITPRQEVAIEEIKKLKQFEDKLKEYLVSMQIQDVVEIEEGIEAIIVTPRSPLLFTEGKAELKPQGRELLDKIIRLLKELPYYNIRIEGHTDPKPIDPFHRYKYHSNWELSYARAVSIANYLIENGMSPERIGVAGYAAEKPRYANDTGENRAKNRRVEIFISFAKTD